MRRWVGAVLVLLAVCSAAARAQSVPVDPAVVGSWKKTVAPGVVQWWIVDQHGGILVFNEEHGRPGPGGRGAISAADGVYTLHLGGENLGGTYSFLPDGRLVLKSPHGTATWARGIAPRPPAVAARRHSAHSAKKGGGFNPIAMIEQAFSGKKRTVTPSSPPPAAAQPPAAPRGRAVAAPGRTAVDEAVVGTWLTRVKGAWIKWIVRNDGKLTVIVQDHGKRTTADGTASSPSPGVLVTNLGRGPNRYQYNLRTVKTQRLMTTIAVNGFKVFWRRTGEAPAEQSAAASPPPAVPGFTPPAFAAAALQANPDAAVVGNWKWEVGDGQIWWWIFEKNGNATLALLRNGVPVKYSNGSAAVLKGWVATPASNWLVIMLGGQKDKPALQFPIHYTLKAVDFPSATLMTTVAHGGKPVVRVKQAHVYINWTAIFIQAALRGFAQKNQKTWGPVLVGLISNLNVADFFHNPLSALVDATLNNPGLRIGGLTNAQTLMGLRLLHGLIQKAAKAGEQKTPEEAQLEQIEELTRQGKYLQAIPLAEQRLAAYEAATPPDPDRILAVKHILAGLYLSAAQYDKARPMYQELFQACSQKYGPSDLNTLDAAEGLAQTSLKVGQYADAENTCKTLLSTLSTRLKTDQAAAAAYKPPAKGKAGKSPAPPDPRLAVAADVNAQAGIEETLAAVYVAREDYKQAEAFYTQARDDYKKCCGTTDRSTLQTQSELADVYRREGDYEKAEQLCEQACRKLIAGVDIGPDHPSTADCRVKLGEIFQDWGRYDEAVQYYRHALATYQSRMGKESYAAADVLEHLGTLHTATGEYKKAEDELGQSLAVYQKGLGSDNPLTARVLVDEGALFAAREDDAKAEDAYRQARASLEKTFGAGNIGTTPALDGLGRLYLQIGDFKDAEPLLKSILDTTQKALGSSHPRVAESLMDLARCASEQQKDAEAEPLLSQALSIDRHAFGDRTVPVARAERALAGLYARMKRMEEAEKLYDEALDAERSSHLGDKPPAARIMMDRARLYLSWGSDKWGRADSDIRHALEIFVRELGPDHPATAAAQRVQARLMLARAVIQEGKLKGTLEGGRIEAIRKLVFAAGATDEKVLENVLSFTDEDQRLKYEARSDPYSLLASLATLAASAQRVPKGEQDRIVSALTQAILRNKGIVLDSLLEDSRWAAQSTDPAVKARVDQLKSDREQISQMTEPPGDEVARKAWNDRRRALETEVGTLEAALARGTASQGKRRSLSVTVRDVASTLPSDAVLVEFIRYDQYSHSSEAPANYGAAVVTAGRAPVWVPLGDAAAIDRLVDAYRQAVRGEQWDAGALAGRSAVIGRIAASPAPSASPATPSASGPGGGVDPDEALLRALYDRVWGPIERVLPRGVHDLVLSPDGPLNFVSFATLLAPPPAAGGATAVVSSVPAGPTRDVFLAEKYTLRYVASGRDLLNKVAPWSGQKTMFAFGNANFDENLTARRLAQRSTRKKPLAHSLARRPERKPHAPAGPYIAAVRGASGVSFPLLPGTQDECHLLHEVASAAGWQWHFLGWNVATRDRLFQVKSPYILHLATHGFFLTDEQLQEVGLTDHQWKSPMARGGLALAGANPTFQMWVEHKPLDPRDEGIVNAADVGNLQLDGTWLVTLSACETGNGKAVTGEGVMGLRRGFVEAGAQNLIMTLWPVADVQTAQMMAEFYAKAKTDGDAPRALTEVQRDWLVKLKAQSLLKAVEIAGPFIISSQGKI